MLLYMGCGLLGCAAVDEAERCTLDGPVEARADDEARVPTRPEPVPAKVTLATPAATPAATPPRATARECVLDLEADAAARWQAEFEEPAGAAEDESPWLRVELPDVDGDGLPETMLSVTDQCGIANCPRLIYVSGLARGGARCPRFVGALWSAYEEVLPARQRGLANLRTYLKNGCAGTAGLFTTYGFDGERYAAMDSVDCRCLADGPDPDRDPLCPGDE